MAKDAKQHEEKLVPFFRIEYDLFAAAVLYGVMFGAGAITTILGHPLIGLAMFVLAGVAGVMAVNESGRRERKP